VVSPFSSEPDRLAAVRAALPSLAAGIYLNTGTCGPLPAETAAAMADQARLELEVGRAHEAYHLESLERMDEARAGVAAVLGGDLREVGITHATTDGMNLATWSVDWRPGDRAVTTRSEHAGALGPLYGVRDRFGVGLEFVDVDQPDDDAIVAAFDRAIGPGTRLVSISHVLWTTGAVLPVARIAEIARARGALIAIDGAQSAGAIPTRVGELDIDFYAVPAQKWLLGPEGTGALWASADAIERAAPSWGGWAAFQQLDSSGTAVHHPDARRFQVSNYHRPSITGFARSVGWLAMHVGLDWAYRRGATLARRTADALAAIDGVELLTPRDRMGTLVSFRIAGWPAAQAVAELGARVFAVVRSIPLVDAIRASVGFFNTEEELDRFVAAVALLAGHTPDTLPPRRTLPILGDR
jgi:L-cysteine/cystine lyase